MRLHHLFLTTALLLFISTISASAGVEASERTDTIEVPHMQCGMCEMKISGTCSR